MDSPAITRLLNHCDHISLLTYYRARTSLRGKNVVQRLAQVRSFTNSKQEMKLTKLFIMMYSAFLLCWIPFLIFGKEINQSAVHNRRLVAVFAVRFGFALSSLLNPIFTISFRRDFMTRISQKSSQDHNVNDTRLGAIFI